jgi:NAD+ synthase
MNNELFDVELATEGCINWIRDWFENHSGKAKGILIPISGGKDSCVVAGLCAKAIGEKKVYGLLIPNGEQKDIADSVLVCEHIGIKYSVINIKNVYESLVKSVEFGTGAVLDKHTLTNIPPRLRMAVAYAVGQEMGYRVAGTGNASEHLVGYFTKWGDGACDFNPIANFTTEEVIAIGDCLGLPEEIVHKTPSDGLCGKTDEDNLGFTYKQVNDYINFGTSFSKEVDALIASKVVAGLHKEQPIPTYNYYSSYNYYSYGEDEIKEVYV